MEKTQAQAAPFFPAETPRTVHWRDDPDADRIDRIRRAYPTEDEYDALFLRKMQRRNSGPYANPSTEQMSGWIRAFLDAHLDGPFRVSQEAWLTGGASKIQFGFSLTWQQDGQEKSDRMVVRMEPKESLNYTSRRREYQMIAAIRDAVPVPTSYWIDAEGEWFPEPAIIYSFITGSSKPSADPSRISGTGSKFPKALRNRLGPQFTANLAAIHSHDVSGHDMSAFQWPKAGTTQSALWQLNRVRRVWEEDRGEDLPIVEHVANWLQDNLPVLDRVSPIHGDYRSGNFLFHEDSATITGWLDWERGYLGDRHRDLAWATTRLFGNMDEEGKEFLVSGVVPEGQFLDEYQRLSGLSVDPKRMHYYRVFNSYQLVASSLGTSYRVVRLNKSHQDVLLSFVEGAAYPLIREMVNTLEEGY